LLTIGEFDAKYIFMEINPVAVFHFLNTKCLQVMNLSMQKLYVIFTFSHDTLGENLAHYIGVPLSLP
jgi:hypothetical protein